MDSGSVQPLTASLILFVLYEACSLWAYVRQARGSGLQYVVVPFIETQILSQLATLFLRWLYTDSLDEGNGWPQWCRFMIKDWSWEDRRRAHEQYGKTFLVVSPAGIICYVADADLAWDVLNRRSDFTKPRDKYKILELYGPNVATAEGGTYRFHVRVTAPPFSDLSGVNELVWQETLRQTKLLADSWAEKSPDSIEKDINSITLAVISLAGFGQKVSCAYDGAQEIPEGYELTFLQAISDVTDHMLQLLVFPTWLLKWTPYARAVRAKTQLERYMREFIRQETEVLDTGRDVQTGPRGNLLKSVMQASRKTSQQTQTSSTEAPVREFNENEVMGNMFIYLFAGYETTANAIAYGLITLALHPDIQARVAQEIDRVYNAAQAEGRKELKYGLDFARLEYTYAFMYEIFRLYPGVTLITKMCKEAQKVLVEDEETKQKRGVVLPPECRVYLSAPAIHYDPNYWPNPEKLQPERWIGDGLRSRYAVDEAALKKHVLASDRTRQMRGTLLTFSDGSRACLGRKFAQAEYVAFLAFLLRDFEVVLGPGIDALQAQRNLDLKSSGKITMSAIQLPRLVLRKRCLGTKS